MVLCVARWEFLEQRPSWAGGIADNVTLWVEPLTLGHAAELAMEAGGLRHDDAERVAQHAGGNPFFIVEIVGHVAPGGARPAAVGACAQRTAAAPHRAGRDRGPHRPALARPRASSCGGRRSSLRGVSTSRSCPARRAPAGAARRGRGRRAADARRGPSRRVAVRLRRAPRRGLRLARQARAPAAAPARGEQAVGGRPGRSLPPHGRVPSGAGGPGRARPESRRSHAGRARRRRPRPRRPHRAPPHRVALGRRPVRARAGHGRARRTLGRAGSLDPERAGRGPLLAGRVRRRRVRAAPRPRARWGLQRQGLRARLAVPRRHHAHDPR